MTDGQQQLLEWVETHVYYRKGYSGKHYSELVCHIMNLMDNRVRECNCCCRWASPYGWVPEAGCSVHDAWEAIDREGVKTAKMSIGVPEFYCPDVCEIIPCSDKAIKQLSAMKEHRP